MKLRLSSETGEFAEGGGGGCSTNRQERKVPGFGGDSFGRQEITRTVY